MWLYVTLQYYFVTNLRLIKQLIVHCFPLQGKKNDIINVVMNKEHLGLNLIPSALQKSVMSHLLRNFKPWFTNAMILIRLLSNVCSKANYFIIFKKGEEQGTGDETKKILWDIVSLIFNSCENGRRRFMPLRSSGIWTDVS